MWSLALAKSWSVARSYYYSRYFSRGLILWPPPGDQAMSAYPLSITPKIVDFCMPKYYLGPRNSVVMSVRWWCRSLGVGHRAHFSFFAMVLSWSPSVVLSLLRWPATRSCTRTPTQCANHVVTTWIPRGYYVVCGTTWIPRGSHVVTMW